MKVWVNGTFDVLHIGHIKLLEFASKFGKVRVGLDSDDRIRKNKGEGRPFNSLEHRLEFMSAIRHVDSVVSFSSDQELESRISEYEPDIMVIGSDYENKIIIGSHLVEKIVFYKRIPNKSTSEILGYENFDNR